MRKFLAFILLVFLCVTFFGCASKSGYTQESTTSETVSVSDKMTVTYIDVGKGDCILLQFKDKSMIIDTGYSYSTDKICEVLEKKGISSLDCLVITHYDKDHVGGAKDIISACSPSVVYLPNYEGDSSAYINMMTVLENNGIPYEKVSEDVTFSFDEADICIYKSEIEYIEGTDDEEGNDNDVSLVVSAVYGDDSYLFPGDIEKKGTKSFLSKDLGSFDVVKMPHHGRKNSNTDDLIEKTGMKYAVITDSEDSPADDETIMLLNDAGAKIYRTSVNGTIEISGNGTGIYTVTTEK